MTEVTVETFREAALRAGERLRGGEGVKEEEKDVKKSLRERLKEILESGDIIEAGSTRDISTRTAERIAEMLWPERGLEIKKKQAEMEVERGALIGYIKEFLREE